MLSADDLSGPGFLLNYQLLEVKQSKDKALGVKLSTAAYSMQTICGGRKTRTLICHNAQILVLCTLQSKVIE